MADFAPTQRLRGVVTSDDRVNRKFHRRRPNKLWVNDIVRREALFDRVEVRDHHVPAVAAAG